MGLRMYLLAAAAAAVTALGTWGWLGWQKVRGLRAELVATELQLGGCNARVKNLLRDKEIDDAVDDLSDSDLGNVPDDWLLPAPADPG